jgi:hydroxymethylpyrimidine pyrophosphatase-like HAD family hydrolase
MTPQVEGLSGRPTAEEGPSELDSKRLLCTHTSEARRAPELLTEETKFYHSYGWCLDPHLTVEQTTEYLRGEISKLARLRVGWQHREVATNVYLLACAVLNACEEAIRGPAVRIPRQLVHRKFWNASRQTLEWVLGSGRTKRGTATAAWIRQIQTGLLPFLQGVVCGPEKQFCIGLTKELSAALERPVPPEIRTKLVGIPSPFRRLDLMPEDIIALGRRFIARCEDRNTPLLLFGLRTSGSYFAPLLQALFLAEGFRTVRQITMQPDKGPGRRELQVLVTCAKAGFTALVLDDSPHTGDTFLAGLDTARRAGFLADRLWALVPLHPANPKGLGALNERFAVILETYEWQKHRLSEPENVAPRLTEYYHARGYVTVRLTQSRRANEINEMLQKQLSGNRGSRFKRVYAVELGRRDGRIEQRIVLAKSVGCGWLGYHAFIIAERLAEHLPSVLGLREGMLYLEWVSQPAGLVERGRLLEASANYVADRVRYLKLQAGSNRRRRLARHDNGLKLLAKTLSRAYGQRLGHFLARAGVEQALLAEACSVPTLIDGRMDRQKWISGPDGFLKVDFEHHGMGKNEVNIVDPAFDLASISMSISLSAEEERKLLRSYVQLSGDSDVERRLYASKLLAGLWAMQSCRDYLFGKGLRSEVQQSYHEMYLHAWDFLTVQTARLCGQHCADGLDPGWASPLVLLDVDGVIDTRTFGFPCTTSAGIQAISTLHRHGFSMALNTARSAAEVQAYCEAYHFAGGVAELGSYLWDATTRREHVLLNPDEIWQLEELRKYLRKLPGVFFDTRYKYSIRAFTYMEKPRGLRGALAQVLSPGNSSNIGQAPISTLAIDHCLTRLGLDRLTFHHTGLDTTITAKRLDKGSGVLALRDLVLTPEAEIIAVGDSDTDLPMFHESTSSFAPGQINCTREANLLGCKVVRCSYQTGLLEIAHSLAHRDGQKCELCRASTRPLSQHKLFLDLLTIADRRAGMRLAGEVLSTRALRFFIS